MSPLRRRAVRPYALSSNLPAFCCPLHLSLHLWPLPHNLFRQRIPEATDRGALRLQLGIARLHPLHELARVDVWVASGVHIFAHELERQTHVDGAGGCGEGLQRGDEAVCGVDERGLRGGAEIAMGGGLQGIEVVDGGFEFLLGNGQQGIKAAAPAHLPSMSSSGLGAMAPRPVVG